MSLSERFRLGWRPDHPLSCGPEAPHPLNRPRTLAHAAPEVEQRRAALSGLPRAQRDGELDNHAAFGVPSRHDAYPSRVGGDARVLPRHDPVAYGACPPLWRQSFYERNAYLFLPEFFSPYFKPGFEGKEFF